MKLEQIREIVEQLDMEFHYGFPAEPSVVYDGMTIGASIYDPKTYVYIKVRTTLLAGDGPEKWEADLVEELIKRLIWEIKPRSKK